MNENQQWGDTWDKIQERPGASFQLSLPVDSYNQPYILPAMMYDTLWAQYTYPSGNSPEPQYPGFLLDVSHIDMADHHVAALGLQPFRGQSPQVNGHSYQAGHSKGLVGPSQPTMGQSFVWTMRSLDSLAESPVMAPDSPCTPERSMKPGEL